MNISLKKLGPIKRGEVNLSKRFTTFVGYNNSGKTYASQLIWELHTALARGANVAITSKSINDIVRTPDLDESYSISINEQIVNSFASDVNTWLNANILDLLFGSGGSDKIGEDFNISLSYEAYNQYYKSSFKNEQYIRIIDKKNIEDEDRIFKIKIDKTANGDEIFVTSELKLASSLFSESSKRTVYLINFLSHKAKSLREAQTIAQDLIKRTIFKELLPKLQRPFFLPAYRTFFTSYYRYVYEHAEKGLNTLSRLTNEKNPEGYLDAVKNISKRNYTHPVSVFMRFLYDINDYEETSIFNDLIVDLEEILGGKIEHESPEGISTPEFMFKMPDQEKIDIYLASSSINQLAPLYLYLKYWAAPSNNFLIIDEPEENLHPENQIKLLNLLVKFADRGNKVLLTTHSPLMANAINNYYMMCLRSEHGIEDVKPDNNEFHYFERPKNLKSSEFGTYFFARERITEYKHTKFGTFHKDFNDIEDKVARLAETLRNELFEIE